MPPIPPDAWTELRSATAQLPAALRGVDDGFMQKQAVLMANLFIDALNASKDDIDARSLRDIEFAFGDLHSFAADLGPASEPFEKPLAEIARQLERLQKQFGLTEDAIALAQSLRSRLAERLDAAEKATFRSAEENVAPPHEPAALSAEARQLRDLLRAGGFETSEIDRLADDPASFENRHCALVIDELDAILVERA